MYKLTARRHFISRLDDLGVIRDATKLDGKKIKRLAYKEIAQDFVQCSSVHGVKYVARWDDKSAILNNVVWTCALIFGLTGAGLMVNKFWERYSSHLTRTLIDTVFAPSWEVPFPAVSICTLTPHHHLFNPEMVEKLKLPHGLDVEQAASILKYAGDTVKSHKSRNETVYTETENILYLNNMSLVEMIDYLRLPCEVMTKSCWWDSKEVSCKDVLRMSYSVNGPCCSFNYLLQDQLKAGSLEPTQNVHFGSDFGLNVVFSDVFFQNRVAANAQEEFNTIGLAIMIHNSYEYPGVEAIQVSLQPSQELLLRVEPEYLWPKHAVLRMTQEERDCMKPEERSLTYFPGAYRESNCNDDCRIRASLDICGCAPYYYALPNYGRSFKVCTLRDVSCLSKHYKQISYYMYDRLRNFSAHCECPSQCQGVSYTIKTTECTVKEARFATQALYRNITGSEAILRVSLASQLHTKMMREAVVNWINLLSSLGGIFSLFLGCSFVSLVESLYFIGLLLRSAFTSERTS